MTRAMLERRILLPVLVGYMTLVALAAWRHEIRPELFDRPAGLARAALAQLGITPGVAVFTSDAGTKPDEKIHALCLSVRVSLPGGRVEQIHPAPDTACPRPSPRLWVTGEEITLYRSAVALRSSVALGRTGKLAPRRRRFPKLLAESIAEHFRRRARARGLEPERYALLWTESRVSYRSGEQRHRIVALLRWHADPEKGVFLTWGPDDRTLADHWPAVGAP